MGRYRNWGTCFRRLSETPTGKGSGDSGIASPASSLDVVTYCRYTLATDFEWDEAKRKANARKHGLDFADAQRVFKGLTVTIFDDRENYGEDRFVTVGVLKSTAVVIVHSERESTIRVISMRPATRNEERNYFETLGNRLETPQGDEGQGH